MAVMTEAKTDKEIQQNVLEELSWDARVQSNEIGVAVKDGVVTLTGWVDSYTKKWAAEEAAHRVKGVRAVANDIEVRIPTMSERTDADIALAVTRAIEWDAVVPTEKVKVTVSKGWVSLEGAVEWQFEKEAAERAARRIIGVRGVTNLIRVQPSTPSPTDIKQRIEAALLRDADTDAQRIQVEVKGSTVTLRGTVRSYAEKQEAARVAWSAPGVKAVENHIQVAP
jgi:osmotically-inducible protein OsmY